LQFTQATDQVRVIQLPDEPAVVNVGSVGQPRDGDPRSCFVVVDGRTVEFHRVAYDFRRTQAKILSAGLHRALADRLACGK
jgi:diadenosine tetraphosphatase ApaH/serine/threonine PP2A family protein phosphatase